MDKEVIQEGVTHTPSKDPHTFRIQGKVTIKSGDDIIAEAQDNHMVNQGLRGIISLLSGISVSCNNAYYINMNSYQNTIYLGNDTTTATTADLTDLVTKLSTLTPTLVNGTDAAQGSFTYWYIRRTAHFAPAAYTGTIGEIGLYMRLPQTLTANGWSYASGSVTYTFPQYMVARFSAGDGDFTAFSYPQDTTLTVEWEIGVSS